MIKEGCRQCPCGSDAINNVVEIMAILGMQDLRHIL